MYLLTVKADFAAAHALRDYGGSCERLHGHNWLVEATAAARKLDHRGLALDFGELKAELRRLLERFDHRMLNEVPPFDECNPTSENLARHLAEELDAALAGREPPVRIYEVRVHESSRAFAAWRPQADPHRLFD
jgi:6-pyruvoyltetrahydropterin/6-carboxytetrahydropterin synthase